MKILVFDFEVFKYDTLLGVYDVNDKKYIQLWNIQDIKDFYQNNKSAIWVGHNNMGYDNFILQAILFDQNPYEISNAIINEHKRMYLNIDLYYYDIMQLHKTSLKTLEAVVGKNISETNVDFNIDRPLTESEKLETESYNRDDLNQTYEDLIMVKSEFQLRLDLIKEFNLPLDCLHYTEAQIAEAVLKPKAIYNIENMPVHPQIYPQLKIKNEQVINYYLNEEFKTSKKLNVVLCGLEHNIGAGGIHAGINTCCDWAYYFDVSGYYNLIMIKYNMLSRAIPEEGKQLYEHMYHEQLRLKKIDPVKRALYKTILLAVSGAQRNKYSKMYDPWTGALIPMVGQVFLVDLLEKLEGKVELIQSNTDGIIAKPLVADNEILDIVNEWQDRTGFVLKMDKIYDIYQRDVNNYIYKDDKGNIHTKGEAVTYYENWKNPLTTGSYNRQEPIILQYCLVEYFINKIKPEYTIIKYKDNYEMFQYICKTLSYDYLSFENGQQIIKLQKVNRCFASKEAGFIFRNKEKDNQLYKHDAYPALPEKVFIHNNDLKTLDKNKIDYLYYVKRAYDKIRKFINEDSN